MIIGPIANDTIYGTWGIITSGWLTEEQALRLLTFGPVYHQVAIKTEKAADSLRFINAVSLSNEEIADYRKTVHREEEQFQKQFLELLGTIIDFEEKE